LLGIWTHGHDRTDWVIPGSMAMTVLTKLFQVPRPWLLTEVFQVPRPWLCWQSYPRFHGCTYRIIPGSTATTVLTELSQVPRPWLYWQLSHVPRPRLFWQNYPRFHGLDCTDRIIPGSTATTVLTELFQLPRPWLYWQLSQISRPWLYWQVSHVPWSWLYWQNYPRFHGHACTDSYSRFHGRDCTDRIIPVFTAMPVLTSILAHKGAVWCYKMSSCCSFNTSVAFTHVRSVCHFVTESELSSCLRHKWRQFVWVEPHVHFIDIIQIVNRGVWRHCVHQSCLDGDSGVPKLCGWSALTSPSVT
jgi:hypothetical protein